jgi:glutamate-ammonia-ligase adenylyltransferase
LPRCRCGPTRTLLHQLAAYNLIPEQQADELEAAYVFLRNLEHRLQYLDDAQTQMLPGSEEDRRRVAEAMGFCRLERVAGETRPDAAQGVPASSSRYSARRRKTSPAIRSPACVRRPAEEALARLVRAGYSDPASALNQLQGAAPGAAATAACRLATRRCSMACCHR